MIHFLTPDGTANFRKLLPLAAAQNTRLIAVNRRDYPGSTPYSPEERAKFERLAASSPDDVNARAEASEIWRDRARELYEYLEDLVQREDIPQPSYGEGGEVRGGIVLVGWSLGSVWAIAFMAHAPSFRSDVQLSKWVRRVVLYGMFAAAADDSGLTI